MLDSLHVDLAGQQPRQQLVAGATEVLDLALEGKYLLCQRCCGTLKAFDQFRGRL